MAWQKGPLPKDSYGWGAVVTYEPAVVSGFYFADFMGDTVKLFPGGRVLKPHEVKWFDNSLTLPPEEETK